LTHGFAAQETQYAAHVSVQIAGRNRLWRKTIIDAGPLRASRAGIRNDPEWKNGDYTTEPRTAPENLGRLFC